MHLLKFLVLLYITNQCLEASEQVEFPHILQLPFDTACQFLWYGLRTLIRKTYGISSLLVTERAYSGSCEWSLFLLMVQVCY